MDLNLQLRYKDTEVPGGLEIARVDPPAKRFIGQRMQRITAMWRNNRIVVTRPDVERLRAILGSRRGSLRDREHLVDLREELEQARIVGAEEIPADVVTLQSEVRVRDSETGISRDYMLVSPAQADVRSGHVSVLAPLGTALLGYREGDEVEWQMPGGVRRLQIERVRQPQRIAAGRREHAASAHAAHLAA